jgi:RimJ/RimL family protein N-acetyltransferase
VVELAGTAVRLRPLTLDDVEAFAASTDGAGDFGPSGEGLRERLRRQIEKAPTLEADGFLSLVVEADGEPVGDIQVRCPRHAFPPGVCELGITLFPAARGRGLGAEAVELLTRWLLAEGGMERVQASTSVDNVAMRRVLERLGYAYEGVLRSFAPGEGGVREDYAMYAAIRAG